MMDSMNNAELDGKVDMHKKDDPNIESRIRRIASGSGCHPNEVKMLLLAHKQFEGMVSKMGKFSFFVITLTCRSASHVWMPLQTFLSHASLTCHAGKSGLMNKNAQARQQQMAAQMRKNPNLINQRLNQMDPRMLQQMGGRDQVMAMMQQMARGGTGGMPGMDAMMGGMPPGGGIPGMGGMDMEAMMNMAQSMGMGAPPGARR